MKTIFDEIAKIGVVPVIAINDADAALGLADALLEGGLPIAEITYRTEAAEQAIAKMQSERPEMMVGAGTVLTDAQLMSAINAGSKFALAPGFDLDIVKTAKKHDLPFAPGIMTPTDLQAALKADCKFMKFFPAGAAGGTNMLKNIAAPFLHLGIGFNPTGGVNINNMQEWLSQPHVKAVGGTWIATAQDIADKNWAAITNNAREAVNKAREIIENNGEA